MNVPSSLKNRRTSPGTDDETKKLPRKDVATGASAAGMRAVTAQVVGFYFRAPVKAFFRARVDYMAYARAINPNVQANLGWSWRVTTPGLLLHAVKTEGWAILPNQILPPLLANVLVGGILYTSYLQVLGGLHEPASRSTKRINPPTPVSRAFAAGFAAGGIQSLVAAPLDALQVRFRMSDMLEGRYNNMWHYARHKLHEIGLRGIFAGWSLSFLKDSIGSGLFFSTFECLKSQAYYGFVTRYYGDFGNLRRRFQPQILSSLDEEGRLVITPHYALEPTFLLLAGIGASFAQQSIVHPLSRIQDVHFQRLESLDHAAQQSTQGRNIMRLYYHAYEKTIEQCRIQAYRIGGWRTYLWGGFVMNTIRHTPSTSAGLIVFELLRRKYALDSEPVKIEKDGYVILLS